MQVEVADFQQHIPVADTRLVPGAACHDLEQEADAKEVGYRVLGEFHHGCQGLNNFLKFLLRGPPSAFDKPFQR